MEEHAPQQPSPAPSDPAPPVDPIRVRAEPLRPGEKRGPTIDVGGGPVGGESGGAIPGVAGGAAAATAAPLDAAAKRSKRWAAVCHLAYLIPFHVPGILLTVIVWMWHRARDPELAEHGREALNMQLTFWLANLVLTLTVVAAPLAMFVWFVGAILCILATVRLADGERYRYPWILRIVA